MPSKITLRKSRPRTISHNPCTSDRHGEDEISETLQRTKRQAVELPSLIETNINKLDKKRAWPSNKKEKLPTINGVESPRNILNKGSNSVKMLLNWQTYWKTSQSIPVSRKPELTMGILGVKRNQIDGRRPASMLEISEHAQLIRNRIKMKTNTGR